MDFDAIAQCQRSMLPFRLRLEQARSRCISKQDEGLIVQQRALIEYAAVSRRERSKQTVRALVMMREITHTRVDDTHGIAPPAELARLRKRVHLSRVYARPSGQGRRRAILIESFDEPTGNR